MLLEVLGSFEYLNGRTKLCLHVIWECLQEVRVICLVWIRAARIAPLHEEVRLMKEQLDQLQSKLYEQGRDG